MFRRMVLIAGAAVMLIGAIGCGGPNWGPMPRPTAEVLSDAQRIDDLEWLDEIVKRVDAQFRHRGSYDEIIRTTVTFLVSPSGRISEVRVDKPSRWDAFDRSCVDAVERVGMLPAPPGDDGDVRVTMQFSSNRAG